MKLVIGHSWVRRLKELDVCDDDFDFLCKGGAFYASMLNEVKCYFRSPSKVRPSFIFVFLGSNDLDNVPDVASVPSVENQCSLFCEVLRSFCPQAKIILAQVEDRYSFGHNEDKRAILCRFKAKSNKFNKWLNKFNGKDGSANF